MAATIRAVANYDTRRLYTVDFFGDDVRVTVTSKASVIRGWIYGILYRHRFRRHRLVVGLGVQWTPGFGDPDPPADTLQLCVGVRCLIIQLYHCDRVPNILRRFLNDTSITFVGVWNSQDAKKLRMSRHALNIWNLLDIRKFVEDSEGRSLARASFEVIVEVCLGYREVKLDPVISRSEWDSFDLRHRQILQATIDAYVCFKLGVEESLWKVWKVQSDPDSDFDSMGF